MSNTEHVKSLQDIADSLALNVCMEQPSWDSPPEFRSQFDHDLALYVDEIRSIADALSAQSAVQEPYGYFYRHRDCKEDYAGFSRKFPDFIPEDSAFVITPVYTHPSSAAQVEEIRNAVNCALDKAAEIAAEEFGGFPITGKFSERIAYRRSLTDAIRALKTPAPSKGEGS